ncbi:ArsR family transcriptional regulator [Candidatus Micrarchaeota archaeon]|nr:ArsR family transcriptional regulator [Candidatus Micrarchaeota archaeon]
MKAGLLGFILRSKQRRKILEILKEPATPTEIAFLSKLAVSHVSRTLKEFEKKGLSKCQNPKRRIGKIYSITRKGRQILAKIASN